MTWMRLSAELAVRARAAAGAPAFRAEVLAAYRELVPYDSAVFTDPDRNDPLTAVDVDLAQLELIRECERNFSRYACDLRKAFEAARREGGFLDGEVFSARERRELPVFCEIVRPQGTRWTLALVPRWRGTSLGMIRLERKGRRPFVRRDLEQAVALLPVIELGLSALRSTASSATFPLPRLGKREAEVAHHVGRGLTSGQIALLLGTSPLTVRNQISRIFDKVGVASRAELATWLARQGSALTSNGALVPSRPGATGR